jgi:ActR/RegA family two-component response regulator
MASRILLVDDDIGVLTAFKKLLGAKGFSIDTAQTIEEAEKLLKSETYAAVIVDLRLTGIFSAQGLEIIKYVREQHFDSRVILITGYGSEEVRRAALELGADCFFEKPVRAEKVAEALASMGIV